MTQKQIHYTFNDRGEWFVQGPATHSDTVNLSATPPLYGMGGYGVAVVPVGCEDLGTYPSLVAAQTAHPDAILGVDALGRTPRMRQLEAKERIDQ